MPPVHSGGYAPNLGAYLKSLKGQPVESSIENLVSLLKRRQIKNSRSCATATAHLLLQVVAKQRWTDVTKVLERIRKVGQRLIEAQPREMAVGNIVRRVLGMIRDEAKEDRIEDFSDSASTSQIGSPRREGFSDVGLPRVGTFSPSPRPPLTTSHTSYPAQHGVPVQQSMFNLLSAAPSPASTPPGTASPHGRAVVDMISLANKMASTTRDLKAEIISGIEEIIDELDQVDDQIASYAQEQISEKEVILTHGSSRSVQKFLLKAAEKRKFTVVVTESYPNHHSTTHTTVTGKAKQDTDGDLDTEAFLKPLSAAGITVILVPDAAIFAIMSRVNKVILATHSVIANGGLVAAAGARIIAKAAKFHKVSVIVVSGVYKLSPEYPFEFESLIEYGDPGNAVGFEDGEFVDKVEVDNPLFDYVPPDLVDFYITNLGTHAPSYLYRIVADHYKSEDINFHKPELQF
ncbi:GCD complex subunit gcd7 [Ciborinia camelliae]|nr:GCD complex subunit gcd7 [Ciborinia camelliae]